MRKIVMAVATVAALAAWAPAAEAQVAGFSGEWTLTFGEWQSAAGGDVQIPGPNTATFTVRASGDSVAGTYAVEGAAAPMQMAGTVKDGKLVVKGTREARRNINGTVETVMLTITIELTREGDGVRGKIAMDSGDGEGVWRAARGARKAP